MKISHRIILVNLIIVAIVLGIAAIAFYSIMYTSLSSQQSQNLISANKNLTFNYRSFLNSLDEEFLTIKNDDPKFLSERFNLSGYLNDFVLEANSLNNQDILQFASKSIVFIPKQNFTIEEFIKYNPYAVINSYKSPSGEVFYFGKIINKDFLNDLAQKIGADIALISDNFTAEVSNPDQNTENTFLLSKAYNYLKQKGNFEVFQGEADNGDIIATIYGLDKPSGIGNNLSFLIFKSHTEITNLRDTLRNILILIGIVGILLALILSYVLTHKLRIRISDLSYATSQTSSGNFNARINVKGKDEIGQLGQAFNLMLDELEKNQRAKNEYSEFITLINKNISLNEISNAALKKILDTCGFVVGALYSIDEGEISLISSYGLSKKEFNSEQNEFFKKIISSQKPIEINSGSFLPTVHTGTIELKIQYLLLIPVIYGQKVIAILELASFEKPTNESKDYLSKIQEQLAIGLTNAKAMVQLENLVNELKKLNEEYQQQNIQIKKQNEKLFELSNQLKAKAEELAIEKDKAEESTKLKSQFLTSMSHELRTPMNSILGLTELILEKASLTGKNRERLEVVFRNGKRLMSLINDILDLSKIESGKMEIRDEDVLLEEIILEVSSTITPLALDKGLIFNIQRKCNTRIIVNTDRGRVTQVLINLLGNAIKFTENGKVDLVVSITTDKMLKFSVVDTGIGISQENQTLIFEEFRQLDGTTTRKYSGTGLGLTICKKIIDLLGGKIWVDSLEGKGSTFSFTLPIRYVQEIKKDTDNNANIYGLNNPTPKRIQKIVIVDDDEIEFEKFKREFKDDKISIEYIQDSEFAFNKIAEVQPDLIIIDLLMPKIDGVKLSRKLKGDLKTKDIPIIISTAQDLSSDEKQSLNNIVEDTAVKSQGHPLDVLRVVRDRIEMQAVKNPELEVTDKNKITLSEGNLLNTGQERYLGDVLIVDDDPDTLFTINEIVQSTGCKTFLAKSGVECLKILEQIHPDLILLDIMMPEMDGFQTLNNIRANNQFADVPIYAVTARAMISDKEIILKHGFNDYIPKPVNSTIISSKIDQLFSKIKSGKE